MSRPKEFIVECDRGILPNDKFIKYLPSPIAIVATPASIHTHRNFRIKFLF